MVGEAVQSVSSTKPPFKAPVQSKAKLEKSTPKPPSPTTDIFPSISVLVSNLFAT